MVGVDLADQLISLYRISIKSKQFYYRLIFHMFDMAVVNSWLLHKRDANSLCTAKNDILQMSLLNVQVAFALIKANKPNNGMKRGRPNPVIERKRNRCKNGNCTGRTNVTCKSAKIVLKNSTK